MKTVGFCEMMVLMVGILRVLQAACPPGWLVWQDSCYILLPKMMGWFEASKTCERPGVSLFVPNSDTEHNIVWEKMKTWKEEFRNSSTGLQLWIDCTRNDTGHFRCSGDGDLTGFRSWAEDQPTNKSGEDCVRMAGRSGGNWRQEECTDPCFVACEMSAIWYECHRSSLRYIHVPQKCLLNHRIKSFPVKMSIECGLACWAEPLCRSFNLRKQADNKKICQLNYASRMEAGVNDIKYRENCYFYEP